MTGFFFSYIFKSTRFNKYNPIWPFLDNLVEIPFITLATGVNFWLFEVLDNAGVAKTTSKSALFFEKTWLNIF